MTGTNSLEVLYFSLKGDEPWIARLRYGIFCFYLLCERVLFAPRPVDITARQGARSTSRNPFWDTGRPCGTQFESSRSEPSGLMDYMFPAME